MSIRLTGLDNSGTNVSIGGLVVSGADKSVLFIRPDNTLAQDPPNFSYNSSTTSLGIGTSNPVYSLDVKSPTGIRSLAFANNSNATISLQTANLPGVGQGQAQIQFFDGTQIGARFLSAFGNPLGGRFFGLMVGTSTNTDQIPLWLGVNMTAGGLAFSPLICLTPSNRVGVGLNNTSPSLTFDVIGDSTISSTLGIGSSATSARLYLPPGTAVASTSPLKFSSGTPLTVTEDGAMEYDTSHLWFTINSTRYQLDQQTGAPHNLLSATHSDTSVAAPALGAIIYGASSAALLWNSLPGNTTTTKKFLVQSGTAAGVSAPPDWGIISAPDLPGSFSGFATPTTKTCLVTIPGVLTTAMRSDASPQIDVAILPSWTGLHTFVQSNIQTTFAHAVELANPTASLAGSQVQQSPSEVFTAHVWSQGAVIDFSSRWRITNIPTAGLIGAPTSKLTWESSISSGVDNFSNKASLSDSGVWDVTTGFRIGGIAATGNYLRGDGANFISSAIQNSDLPANPTFSSVVFTNSVGGTADGQTWHDTTRQALMTYVGCSQTVSTCLFVGTSDLTNSNSNAEIGLTPLGIGLSTSNPTLPANFLVPGKTLKIQAWGRYSSSAAAPLTTLRFKLGNSVLHSTTMLTVANTTLPGQAWWYEGTATCNATGANGTVTAQGTLFRAVNIGTGTTWSVVMSTGTTINTTATQMVSLTNQWSAASPSNTMICTNFILECVN